MIFASHKAQGELQEGHKLYYAPEAASQSATGHGDLP